MAGKLPFQMQQKRAAFLALAGKSLTRLKRLSMRAHTALPHGFSWEETLLHWPGSQSWGLNLAGLDVQGPP